MVIRSTVVRWWVGVAAAAMTMFPSPAPASPRARVAPDRAEPGAPRTATVCGEGEIRCFAHVHLDATGQIAARADAGPPGPDGLGPADLQSAYQVDPTRAAQATVAIVDAYGYANLEADLGVYRAQFGLPACTRSNGCLKVVNQNGQTSPLPANPPPSDDWTIETALDMDVASAVCPSCKLLIVLADSPSFINLYTAQNSAAAAGPSVISDSWGSAEEPGEDLSAHEPYFNHPGIAQFVSSGDSGYNEGGDGPVYPSTSSHVIAVGGTALTKDSSARGWRETAWTKAGSSCSLSIAKPAYQGATGCNFRAAADISAVGDPATGVAVYNAANGGWLVIGGTSAAAPIVAAIFAASGRGNATAAQIAQNPGQLFDITQGSNGSCGPPLCVAGTGWDGPTGYGTPNASALAGGAGPGGPGDPGGPLSVAITSPADGDTLDAGFTVTATATGASKVGLFIDGDLVTSTTAPPYSFRTPLNLFGRHTIDVAAVDAQMHLVTASIHVVVRLGATTDPPPEPEDRMAAGCQVGRGAPSSLAFALIAALIALGRARPARSNG